jgi:hypothetical protein
MRSNRRLRSATGLIGLILLASAAHAQAAKNPNILVIWGDDIGGLEPQRLQPAA